LFIYDVVLHRFISSFTIDVFSHAESMPNKNSYSFSIIYLFLVSQALSNN